MRYLYLLRALRELNFIRAGANKQARASFRIKIVRVGVGVPVGGYVAVDPPMQTNELSTKARKAFELCCDVCLFAWAG